MWWHRFIIYGALGLLVENVFTGVYSLCQGDWKGTTRSYFLIPVVYGSAGLTLEFLRDIMTFAFYLKALVYVPVIYSFEAGFGLLLARLTGYLQALFGGHGGGVIFWHYGQSVWSPGGLIQLKYAPAWYFLGLLFEPICSGVEKVLPLLR